MKAFIAMMLVLFSIAAHAEEPVSVSKVFMVERNSGASADKDAVLVYANLGNERGDLLRSYAGVLVDFSVEVYLFENDVLGKLVGKGSAKVKTEVGRPSLLVRLPDVKKKTRLAAHVTVTLPGGKVLRGRGANYFDPLMY